MIFALDVGNTNIVLGVFGDDYNMMHSWRIATDNTKTWTCVNTDVIWK